MVEISGVVLVGVIFLFTFCSCVKFLRFVI